MGRESTDLKLRRDFLKQIATISGGMMLNSVPFQSQTASSLPDPSTSGIEHIVFVIMENRSFDHYLGWLPSADGKQAGLSYVDREGESHPTYHLSDFQGCGHPDPDHSFAGGRMELNGGNCDGWLRAGQNDAYAIGYYTQDDLAFFGDAVQHWTVFDRYFSSIMAETFPNRMYQHTPRLTESKILWSRHRFRRYGINSPRTVLQADTITATFRSWRFGGRSICPSVLFSLPLLKTVPPVPYRRFLLSNRVFSVRSSASLATTTPLRTFATGRHSFIKSTNH